MAQLFECYNAGDNGNADVSGAYQSAQTFTPSTAHKITSVKLKLYREGSPGTVTVSIRATDANGHPAGGDLCYGTTNGNTLPTAKPYEWREITLGDGYNLAADVKYAVTARAPTGDEANFVWWRYDGSGEYAGGNYEYSNNDGSSWSSQAGYDFMFEDWGEPLGFGVTIEVPLATVSSEALVPVMIAGTGVIIEVPLALVSSEALAPLFPLGVTVEVPLSELSAQAYVPRVLNMRMQGSVRSLAAFRVLHSIREEERL